MIQIRDLKVDLGEFVLQRINIDVREGEYFIILGPTGAGKTVLLEAIAGLHPVLEGKIWVKGREVTRLRPEKRGIGIVYQDQVLFPHLSVAENIAFGLKSMKCPGKHIKPRVNSISELVGINHLLHRRPDTLSGGEKQKTALARALVTEPVVLLLDEPLSALDQSTRENMQRELAELHRRLKVTMIHVTHDFEEAVTLGERVAVINEGQIAQVGTPEEVLRRPNSEFVARFALSRNIFSGIADDAGDGYVTVRIGGTELMGITDLRGAVHLSLRPEDILISNEALQSTARNSFEGTVTEVVDRGAVMHVTVSVPPDFVCLVTRQAFEELKLRKGVRVWITFKASAIHIF
jgi:molybdate transport system ATP-binding protein